MTRWQPFDNPQKSLNSKWKSLPLPVWILRGLARPVLSSLHSGFDMNILPRRTLLFICTSCAALAPSSARAMDYSTPLSVRLEARDDEKEYAIEVQRGTNWKKKARWTIAPMPYMLATLSARSLSFLTSCRSDKGYIKLKTTALGSEIASYLYIHRRTSEYIALVLILEWSAADDSLRSRLEQ